MRVYRSSFGFLASLAVLGQAVPAPAAEVQVAQAALVPISNVTVQQAGAGFQLVLQTNGGAQRPQVITAVQGDRLLANVLNAQLTLPSGRPSFRQDNPVPGIAFVQVTQASPDAVEIVVAGVDGAPVGQILQQEASQTVLGFAPNGASSPLGLAAVNRPAPQAPEAAPPRPANIPDELSLVPAEEFQAEPSAVPQSQAAAPASPQQPSQFSSPPTPAQQPQAPPTFNLDTSQLAQRTDVLVPNPDVTVDGRPAPLSQPAQPIAPAPPLLPRAVPPPVGDIAVSNINTAPQVIDLGTAARVPRIVLQDAPVRDVLSLLARSADLNLIYSDVGQDEQGSQPQEGGPVISLDLQNEPVQDVFNYVIQAANLEAARRGRTIFVGSQLPTSALNIVTRTFRLNQAEVASASAFLSAQGAETQRVVETRTRTVEGEGVDRRVVEEVRTEIRPLGAEEGTGPLLLRGLSVLTDERLNALTLVGEPDKVQLATSFLTQLDARNRQVAINVKIIDVNLSNIGRFGTSFSFGINDTGVINQSGIGIINFGTSNANISGTDVDLPDVPNDGLGIDNFPITGQVTPQTTSITGTSVGQDVVPANRAQTFDVVNSFLAQLQFAIQNNNAKVLTDPTLIVQEGSTATVNLTQDFLQRITRTTVDSVSGTRTETDPELATGEEGAGLNLSVLVERIDDNGFVTMSIAPSVTSIAQERTFDDVTVTLLNRRNLDSGTVRLRDGQTLILTGIIQDQDRVEAQKIPFLGDLPIIGALFRRTTRTNERAEVIVMVTPRLLSDAQRSNFGYTYTPGSDEARQMLQRQGFPTPQQ